MPSPNKDYFLPAAQMHKPGSRKWFTIKAESDGTREVFIYDEIGRGFFGGGVAAEDFIKEIKALNLKARDELLVRVNSPGGDMFDGNAIYNYLNSIKATVTMRVDGVAASAASLIVMAGDTIEMPENAFLFIHNPWMMAIGDGNVMRKAADTLDQMGEAMAATYQRRTGADLATIKNIMDDETWLTAAEAVEFGFADEINEPVRAAALAQFDLSRYGFPVPEPLAAAARNDISEKRATLQKLRDAGNASRA